MTPTVTTVSSRPDEPRGASDKRAEADQKAVEAIVASYYPNVLREPTSARTRAQIAFSISGAVATVLASLGLVADIDRLGTLAKTTGAVAIALWIVAAGLFARVVATIMTPSKVEDLTATGLVRKALSEARAETLTIVGRTSVALRWTWAAAAATVAAVLCALFLPVPWTHSELLVTPGSQVEKECGQRLRATVDPVSLEGDFLRFRVIAGDCAGNTFYVPVSQVDIIRSK